ncbi:MAG: hypothetical protein Q9174_002574 [Haloplaca sp. 1 TL-2023]
MHEYLRSNSLAESLNNSIGPDSTDNEITNMRTACGAVLQTCGRRAWNAVRGMNDLATMMQAVEREMRPPVQSIQTKAMHILRQLDQLRCSSFRDVDEYATAFKRLVAELDDMGFGSEQQPMLIVTTFLLHLGPSFDQFRTFFSNLYSAVSEPGKQLVTLDDTIRLATADQQARRQNEVATPHPEPSDPAAEPVIENFCTYCNIYGHIRQLCGELHPALRAAFNEGRRRKRQFARRRGGARARARHAAACDSYRPIYANNAQEPERPVLGATSGNRRRVAKKSRRVVESKYRVVKKSSAPSRSLFDRIVKTEVDP